MKLPVQNVALTIKFGLLRVGKYSSTYTLPDTVLTEIGD